MTATTRWDMAFRALPGIPLVEPGENLPALIVKAAENDGFSFADGDVLVVAQKIVSKAERRIVRLDDVTPSEHTQKLGRITGRDARLCQLYLDESKAIIEIKGRHVVTIHRLGFQGTGAGVDMSNVGKRSDGYAVLLPTDPDASARAIRDHVREATGATVAMIVSDSFGSAVREGAYGAAIGIVGIRHLEEPDGEADLFGDPSKPTMNRGDEIASAASILMGQTAAARPVVVGRGIPFTVDEHASLARLLIEPQLPETDQTSPSTPDRSRPIRPGRHSPESASVSTPATATLTGASVTTCSAAATCLEFGEEGFVGRGNTVSGFVPVHRPKSVEAAFGKSPTYHAGKVYALYADRIARTVHTTTGVAATVTIVARHSDPIRHPAMVHVALHGNAEPATVAETSRTVLATTDHLAVALDGYLVPR